MIRIHAGSLLKWAVLLLSSGILSCSSIPRLNVSYELPPGSAQRVGTPVFLSVQDDRANKETFGMGARREFGAPEASISLTLRSGDGEGQSLGIIDIPMLLKEAFQRRIAKAGLDVLPEKRSRDPEITILLKTFSLDLVDRKWLFDMSYEAQLSKEGRVVSTQTITGKGERMKIYGYKQADDVVTEVFTDELNQFDAAKLLRQGGL
jgi:hypothetical protein